MVKIKRGLTVLLLGLLASFSINAAYYKIAHVYDWKIDQCGFDKSLIGQVVSDSAFQGCVGGLAYNDFNWRTHTIGQVYFSTNLYARSTSGASLTLATAIPISSCPSGTVLVNGVCQNKCKQFEGEKTDSQKWSYSKYGDRPSICSSNCELMSVGVSLCTVSSGECVGNFAYTGETCSTADGMVEGGTKPDPVPNGCEHIAGMYICTKDINGDGQPDPGAEIDKEARCDYSGPEFKCHGGSYSKDPYEPTDPTKPIEDPAEPGGITPPDNQPIDVDVPDVDESNTGDLTGIIKAIKEQNKDLNLTITELNKNENKNASELLNRADTTNQHLENINKALVESTKKNKEIYENQKELSLNSTTDIVNAIRDSGEFDDLRNDQIINALEQLGNRLSNDAEIGKHTPSSSITVKDKVFGDDAIAAIKTENESLKANLKEIINSAKDIVSVSTEFNNGTLSSEVINIRGNEIKIGLDRFAGVSGYVYPVILFICTLIGLFIVFGRRQ